MTPWLNRGAKKTNEPTIPLIFRSFGWLNRAALASAGGRSSNISISDVAVWRRVSCWSHAAARWPVVAGSYGVLAKAWC